MKHDIFTEGLLRYYTEEELLRIRSAVIGIAGAGGLGSNAAHMLVRSGFRRFVLADFDCVEPSNLNRQFFYPAQIGQKKVYALRENLLAVDPGIHAECFAGRVERENMPELFSGCDILIEALDGAESKAEFVSCALQMGKPVVCACGVCGCGNTDAVQIKKISASLYIVGDGKTEASRQTPPLCPRVVLAAAKQADIALCLILGKEVAVYDA